MATITSRNTISGVTNGLPYQKVSVTVGTNTYIHQVTAVAGDVITVQPALVSASGSCTATIQSAGAIYYPMVDFSKGNGIPNPSRPLGEGVKASTLVSSFDSGHEQRRMKSSPKRTFDLSYNALSHGEYATIRDFFLKVMNVTPFLWVHPIEKTEILVKFSMDTFTGNNKSHGPKGPIYETQVKLEQVWS